MKALPVLFWALALLTLGVSYRWGSLIGLLFFLFTFVIGAAVAQHLGLH